MGDVPDDVSAFLAARWAGLVALAEDLGAPPGLAVEVATDAADRLTRRWRRVRDEADPAAVAALLVVEAWDDVRRTPWWRRHPAVGSDLDALPAGERTALLLQEGPTPGLRRPPPPPSVLDRAGARRDRRRRWRRRAAVRTAVAAVAIVAVGGVGWAATGARTGTGADPTVLAAVPARDGVSVEPDQAWLTWWAAGELHVGDAVLEVPVVSALVRTADGAAVYVDGSGRLVRARPDGTRRLVGHTAAPASLVVSDDGSRVAWVEDDQSAAGPGSLVVADTASLATASDVGATGPGRRVLTLPTAGGVRPVAVTREQVWLTGDDGTSTWQYAAAGSPVTVVDGRPLEAVGGDRVALGGGVSGGAGTAVAAADGIGDPGELVVAAGDVVISRDGAVVVTIADDGTSHVDHATTGASLPTGVPSGFAALSAATGPDGQVAWVLARAADRPTSEDYLRSSFTGTVSVLTCRLPDASTARTRCTPLTSVSGTAGAPLLAR